LYKIDSGQRAAGSGQRAAGSGQRAAGSGKSDGRWGEGHTKRTVSTQKNKKNYIIVFEFFIFFWNLN
jgi:hypothetical protein